MQEELRAVYYLLLFWEMGFKGNLSLPRVELHRAITPAERTLDRLWTGEK